MRQRAFLRFIFVVLTFCAPLLTATQRAVYAREDANLLVMPTDEDRQLAARYSALIQELDKAESPALELIHQAPKEQVAEFLNVLTSTTRVERWALFRARRYMRRMLPQFEALQQLAPPSPYSIEKRRGEISIDGKLDEAAWQRATPMPIRYDRLKKVAGEAATVRLLWDEKFLYAAFQVPDTNILAPKVERDGPVWRSDCVELFLMPNRHAGVYWEIEISATGDIYDALCTKYSDRWSSDMKVEKSFQGLQFGRMLRGTPNQSNDRDAGYTMEVAVPFDQLPDFSRSPRGGDCIYALLGWINRDEPGETMALAQVPFVSWFHNIWMYQPLVLER
jgi:hypothetical protein